MRITEIISWLPGVSPWASYRGDHAGTLRFLLFNPISQGRGLEIRYRSKNRSLRPARAGYPGVKVIGFNRRPVMQLPRGVPMSLQDDNKAIVGRWFTHFWGETCNLRVVDEFAAPDML